MPAPRQTRQSKEVKRKYNFYLPVALVELLRASAERNRRGVGPELAVILEQHLGTLTGSQSNSAA